MSKKNTKLTDKDVLNAVRRSKDYKIYDQEGLCMVIRRTGKKVWQYHYQYQSKRKTLTIGPYHQSSKKPGHVGLKEARLAKYEAFALLNQGVDPNEHKKIQIKGVPGADETTFKSLAGEWHGKGVWVPKHAKNILRSLEGDVFPLIGKKQITEISGRDIIGVLTQIEEREAYDVAKRVCQRCEAIFDYAINKGVCDDNPALGRSKFVSKPRIKHRSHFKEDELPEFLSRLSKYHGRGYIKIAMQLLVLMFLRPGELRYLKWVFIDEEKAVIKIPAEIMKMNRDHTVPLSYQALALLEELRSITGKNELLFPSVKNNRDPISDVTLTKVLRVMGYSGTKVVPSGMRHTASTILNEHGFNGDHIEEQLAHVQKNKVRSVYNHAEYLEDRKTMMQWYADHLDKLKEKHHATQIISAKETV